MGRIVVAAAVLCAAAVLYFTLRTEKPDATSAPATATPREGAPSAATDPVEGPALHGTRRPGEAQSPAAPQPVAAGTPGASCVYHGKVVTAAGLPAAGAKVEALVAGSVLASHLTDAEGAFRFQLTLPTSVQDPHGCLRARGDDGSVALGLLPLLARVGPLGPEPVPDPDAPRDVGTLRLGPSHALEVRVLAPGGAGQSATLWLLPATVMFAVPWTLQETDADGRARLEGLPAGSWLVVAAAPGRGRGRAPVHLPREASSPVEIQLAEPHTLTVRVRDAADQAPIAGAVVNVVERVRMPDYSTRAPLHSSPASITTDAEGVARIERLSGQETLLLAAEAAGYPSAAAAGRGHGGGAGEARTEPGQSEVVIELHKPLTIRWPLTNAGVGIPADGTEVRIEPWTNTGRLVVPPRGVIEGQELVVPGWGSDGAAGYAVIANHGIARFQAGPKETRGTPIAFFPLRKIELVARLADGAPAVGWFLVVRDGGNNAVKPGVKTDAEGRATMDGLYGGAGSLVDVSVSQADGWGGFVLALGSVNLLERDGRFEATIPAERTLRIRLTVLGAAVPEGFTGWPTLDHVRLDATQPGSRVLEPGLLEVRWRPHRPDAGAMLSAHAEGYLAETKQVPPSALVDGSEVVIDLRPAGSVRILVKEPEDKRYRVAVDRWNAEKGDWQTPDAFGAFASNRGQRADANGVVAIQNLEPGRYRAVETTSGLVSEPFEVRAGNTPTPVTFDVSATGWAKGRVVVPEGVPFTGISVGEPDARPGGQPAMWGQVSLPGTPVNPQDGTFWIRVPGTRPVTLRIFHTTLRPHPSLGQVTLTKPQEGLELHAVRGATARLRFTTPAPVYFNRGQARPIAVRLYSGSVEGPGTPLAGMLDGAHQTVEFGGYAPGTYSVWIDAPGSIPVVLEGVSLGSDDVDLGEVALSEGSSLELSVSVKEGQSPPRFSVWAERLDEPTYTRSTDAAGATITLRGLGPGRFRVTATPYNGAAPAIREEIAFDGQSKVVRRIDAR